MIIASRSASRVIYYRYAKGITTYARFAQFIFAVRRLAEQARTSIERKAN